MMKSKIAFKMICVFIVAIIFIHASQFDNIPSQIAGKNVKEIFWNNKVSYCIDGEVSILFEDGVSQKEKNNLISKINGKVINSIEDWNWVNISFNNEIDLIEILEMLNKESSVKIAEPNFIVKACYEPTDLKSYQWSLKNVGGYGYLADADIDAPEAWNFTRGSDNVIIAIFDTGIPLYYGELCHEDLLDSDRIIVDSNYDFIDDGSGIMDDIGHGTHVAGIIGAETNNNLTGIAGIASGCKLLPVQVITNQGYGAESAIITALSTIVSRADNDSNHRYVFNLSIYSENSSGLFNAILGGNNEIPIVVAAGNGGYQYMASTVKYPAKYSSLPNCQHVISVSATDEEDDIASYSSRGPEVTIAAPGGSNYGIVSTYLGYGPFIDTNTPGVFWDYLNGNMNYAILSGTSMAAPHVSAVAGLILSINENLLATQVRDIIEESADIVGDTSEDYWEWDFGHGRLNAYKALKYTIENYGATLDNEQTFNDSLKLIESLSINSGATLTIAPGSILNLNSHLITSNGGTIEVDGAILVPADVRIMSDTTIVALCPSVTDAIEIAEAGQTIEVRGDYDFGSEDITITTSNVTLQFMPGSHITIGSTPIFEGLGSISVQSGATLLPDIRTYSNGEIWALYSTIESGLTSGTTIEVRGNYVQSNTLTVSSGQTLELKSGSNISFGASAWLDIYGTLTATSATLTKSTSSVWSGIRLRANCSSSISNCTISGATYGLYVKYVAPTISGNTITATTGIYNYHASPTIVGNTITANYGIRNNYYSSPNIASNNITVAYYGIYCEDHSSPNIATYGYGAAFNYIHGFMFYGIYAVNYSYPTLGTTECYGNGYNSIVSSSCDALAFADVNASIYAPNNWWGDDDPDEMFFVGNVTYLPCLESEPTYSYLSISPENNLYENRFELLSKSPASEISPENTISSDLTVYYNDHWELQKKIRFLRYLYSQGETVKVADLCKNIVEDHSDSPEASVALNLMYQIANNENINKDFDNSMLKDYLKKSINRFGDSRLDANIELMLASLEGDSGMKRLDKVYQEYKGKSIGKYALRQKFMYFFNDLEDIDGAREVLDLMDKVYPKEIVTYESHQLMGDDVGDPSEIYGVVVKQENLSSSEELNAIPEEYSLNPAFPNPFNPNTTLEFALPVQSEVKCSIYNIRGDLVKEYSYEQNAGTYSIVWDASNVSSGIYLIRFVAEAADGSETFVDYQKVTLLK